MLDLSLNNRILSCCLVLIFEMNIVFVLICRKYIILVSSFKVIPQFCIAHPFCAYFNNKSLRNIFKMAAIFLQKNRSKRARNGRFSGLKRISKKKNIVKT